ncbi:MAG: PilZ domain-containing protein [Nitrospinae bacterium]|nr:PilZ domain-containing protein [Nitrospinota bacterium]MCH7651585.1 PilZ domain-containing protein [Nitrospinota bacterium]MCH8932466.1 PilZ domain-containing protein [Nitrospinota bacterium]TDJ51058.1 MAG: PilZ domain-containing protein [Nitrospina sp.]TDJ61920.1 MAG: PilZ domain-containing protein [Nitrospina sp.]
MKIKSSENHREFSRVAIKVQANIQAKGRAIVSRDTQDISMKGLFVKGEADWPVGTECEIHLLLEGQDPPVDLSVKGRVQRVTEDGMGLLFTEVGLEAYEHLHNLVMLNTHEPDEVEQEFKNHRGLKKK